MIRVGAPFVVRKNHPKGRPGLTEPGSNATSGRAWLASLRAELAAQRRIMAGLVDFCEADPVVTSLSVGCSLGRGAGDSLSDIDAALGLQAERGHAGAEPVLAMEAKVTALLPSLGPLVDVLRHRVGPADRFARRIFAQFADGAQLDLAVIAEAEVRRGEAAPDFVTLYRGASQSEASDAPPAGVVTGEQVREWAFFGWCALIDADKYLRRGSLWEAHNRLHEARHHIWALWAAATGAIYPWHGLSQVLDHDPDVPMTRELSTDPYVPLIGSLPPDASELQARDFIDRQRGRRAALPGRTARGHGPLRHRCPLGRRARPDQESPLTLEDDAR